LHAIWSHAVGQAIGQKAPIDVQNNQLARLEYPIWAYFNYDEVSAIQADAYHFAGGAIALGKRGSMNSAHDLPLRPCADIKSECQKKQDHYQHPNDAN
jgi:hypothetical protein